MLQLTSPDFEDLRALRDAKRREPLSYDVVEGTRGELPEGWDTEQQWIEVGMGAEVFARTVEAVKAWRMFGLPWVRLEPVPVEPGTVVAFASKQFGMWMLHACRVVYVEESERSYAFAYGTLRGHAVAGEEKFEVIWDEDDRVRFGIRKFSRLDHPLARLGAPVARSLQHRFTGEALQAIERVVTSP